MSIIKSRKTVKTAEFTKNDNLTKISRIKEFAPFKDDVMGPNRHFRKVAFKHLPKYYAISTEICIDTVSRMRNLARKSDNFMTVLESGARLYSFVIGQNKPFALVLPGGAYRDVSTFMEGFAVASELNKRGYNAFVLSYRTDKLAHYPNPTDDVAAALNNVFARAEALEIDTADYAVFGFSAGGHLAASWGTKTLGYQKYNLQKPKTVVLSYPVVTMGKYTHKVSRDNLLAEDRTNAEVCRAHSVELLVDGDYPGTFVWHCDLDPIVPVENAKNLASALAEHGVAHELHVIHGAVHGWALGIGKPAEGWLQQALDFMAR